MRSRYTTGTVHALVGQTETVRMQILNPADIQSLFERFEAKDESPRTELNFSSPYTLLVAVALSAQATDVSVNKATERLFALAQTPQEMLRLGLDRVTEEIRTIGLFRNKAKNVIALSQILVEQYDGEVPLRRIALEALPGVGRKTASVVLNELGVEPAVAVDTHVFRVAHRLGLATGKTPDKIPSLAHSSWAIRLRRPETEV
eukprot:gene14855-14990_t